MLEAINAVKRLKNVLSGYKWFDSIGVISTKDKTVIVVNVKTKITKTIEKNVPSQIDGFVTQINEINKKVNYVIGV